MAESPMNDVLVGPDMAYDSQLFGFTPQSFCDGVYNALNDYLHDCMDAMTTYITKEFGSIITPEQVAAASQSLIPRFIKTFDKAFDKLEAYTMTLFHIPSNILLPEDESQLTQYMSTEEDQLDESIKQLETKITNLTYVNSALRQELEDIEVVQSEYDNILKQLIRLQQACQEAGVPDLKEAITFTCNKATKLNDVIKKLKPVSHRRRKYFVAKEKIDSDSKKIKT